MVLVSVSLTRTRMSAAIDERPCNGTEYMCEHDQHCISRSLLCDGTNDCGDWSDEQQDCKRQYICTYACMHVLSHACTRINTLSVYQLICMFFTRPVYYYNEYFCYTNYSAKCFSISPIQRCLHASVFAACEQERKNSLFCDSDQVMFTPAFTDSQADTDLLDMHINCH